jgi:hypothetical protein
MLLFDFIILNTIYNKYLTLYVICVANNSNGYSYKMENVIFCPDRWMVLETRFQN